MHSRFAIVYMFDFGIPDDAKLNAYKLPNKEERVVMLLTCGIKNLATTASILPLFRHERSVGCEMFSSGEHKTMHIFVRVQ